MRTLNAFADTTPKSYRNRHTAFQALTEAEKVTKDLDGTWAVLERADGRQALVWIMGRGPTAVDDAMVVLHGLKHAVFGA